MADRPAIRRMEPELVDHAQAAAYKCPLCRGLLVKPLQVSCGHRFCSSCISELFRNPPPVCPEDNIPMIKEEVFRDIFAEREIASLRVRCSSVRYGEGCRWIGELRDLEKHEKECSFKVESCPNRGCAREVHRGRLGHHLQHSCQFRVIQCPHCNLQMPAGQLQRHMDEDCENVEIPCANGCGVWILRNRRAEHLRECYLAKNECEFVQEGCTFQGNHRQLHEHNQQEAVKHVSLLCIQRRKDRDTISSLESQVQTLKRTVAGVKSDVERLQQQVSLTFNAGGNSSSGWPHSGGSSSRHSGRYSSDQPTGSAYIEDRLARLQLESQNESKSRKDMERTIARHEVSLRDMAVRVNLQDIKMTNGVLVWKISEFSRRRQVAMERSTTSLYSPPFHTSPAGYKLCARLYPNGDGVGRGSHLSLFFVVMRGEFDALLAWPFSQKVSLMLLDQRRVNPHDCTETFRPDSASSSFQRPVGEMNVASGCPLFMPLAQLDGHSNYVVDDTIFIKVVVHDGGVRPPDVWPG